VIRIQILFFSNKYAGFSVLLRYADVPLGPKLIAQAYAIITASLDPRIGQWSAAITTGVIAIVNAAAPATALVSYSIGSESFVIATTGTDEIAGTVIGAAANMINAETPSFIQAA
jgi:hypothetical protein